MIVFGHTSFKFAEGSDWIIPYANTIGMKKGEIG